MVAPLAAAALANPEAVKAAGVAAKYTGMGLLITVTTPLAIYFGWRFFGGMLKRISEDASNE